MIIKIRPTESGDLYDLSCLWADGVKEEFGKDTIPDYLTWERMTDNSLACDKNFVMLVAEVDDTLVGFVEGRKFYEPANGKIYGISQHIYVVPEYRKTGVAPRLYRAFANKMWGMGVDIISLVCVPARQEFWARKGFKPTYMIFSKECRKK